MNPYHKPTRGFGEEPDYHKGLREGWQEGADAQAVLSAKRIAELEARLEGAFSYAEELRAIIVDLGKAERARREG